MKTRSTRWASPEEIAAAEQAWPRSIPDAIHIAAIQKETGLSAATAKLALDIARGDSEGDEITVDQLAVARRVLGRV